MVSRWWQLDAWAGVDLVRPLVGGHRNEVMLASRGNQQLVVRRSKRSFESLAWELSLLEHLLGHGIGVPRVVVADDGRRHVDGVVVSQFVEGREPSDSLDWRRVVDTLTAMHELTTGWPQRPGFASSRQLLNTDRGGDVRLDAMPAGAVDAIRAAWQPMQGPECVVHGDVGASNIRVDGDRVTLLDWDEARVDLSSFDFASVPEEVEVPAATSRQALRTAGVAWEAATCWTAEPDYAARRLAELYDRQASMASANDKGSISIS
ncbi:phosphotransferase enzyme family protein [Micromonospora deserti]|nr:phosphotransferase [Micromonospora deserti]